MIYTYSQGDDIRYSQGDNIRKIPDLKTVHFVRENLTAGCNIRGETYVCCKVWRFKAA
jgi:hypothetical protein